MPFSGSRLWARNTFGFLSSSLLDHDQVLAVIGLSKFITDQFPSVYNYQLDNQLSLTLFIWAHYSSESVKCTCSYWDLFGRKLTSSTAPRRRPCGRFQIPIDNTKHLIFTTMTPSMRSIHTPNSVSFNPHPLLAHGPRQDSFNSYAAFMFLGFPTILSNALTRNVHKS